MMYSEIVRELNSGNWVKYDTKKTWNGVPIYAAYLNIGLLPVNTNKWIGFSGSTIVPKHVLYIL